VPASFSILRQQQFRWASGFAGCLKKYLRSLVTTKQMSFVQKAEAVVYLTDYFASPLIAVGVLLAILYCLVFPLDFILNGYRSDALVAFTVLMSALIYTAPLALFIVAAFRSTNGLLRRVGRLVDLVYLGVLSVAIFLTSARAVLNGFLNRAVYFYRTPKDGDAATSQASD
jgi:cellulose synthase/poly-beta-1,6-N-acetylglucosamine synthase-like glycosyltransferase